MATNNERATRKALIAAYGGTGNTATEKDFDKSLIAAVTASTVKTKPAVVALTNASVAHALNATFSDTEVEAALDALGAKINTIIAALKA